MLPVTLSGVYSHILGASSWLTAAAALPAPHAYTEKKIRRNLPMEIRKFEEKSQVTVTPYQVITHDDNTYSQTSTLPIKKENPYNFFTQDAQGYFRIRLKSRPVRTVQRVRVMLGEQVVYTIPPQWFSIKKLTGDFNVMPVNGSLLISSAAAAFSLIGMSFGPYDYMPNVLNIDYEIGYPDNWWVDPKEYKVAQAGTATTTLGSRQVVGVGTDFTDLEDGQSLYLNGSYVGHVADIVSATVLNLEWVAETAIVGGTILAGEGLPNPLYADMVGIFEKMGALAICNQIAQLADFGLSGVNMGGGVSSEGYTYDRLVGRKQELQAEIEEWMQLKEDKSVGILLGVL